MAGQEQDFRSKKIDSLPELERQQIALKARDLLRMASALQEALVEVDTTDLASTTGELVTNNPFFKRLAYPDGPKLVHGYDEIAARLLNATHDTSPDDVQRVFSVIHPAQSPNI